MPDMNDPSYFELEREKLINQVSENLGKLIASVNALNRKVEANVGVGKEFQSVSKLWKEYERVMAYTGEDTLSTAIPLASVSPDDARRDESFGVMAPGAGSTSYLH